MKQSHIKLLDELVKGLRGDEYAVVMRINLQRKTLIVVISLSDKDIEQFSDIGKIDTPAK